MAEPIQCNACEKVATVHLTQIVNGHVKKIDLCESCAKEKGVTDPEGFSLAELLSNTSPTTSHQSADTNTTSSSLSCPSCGFTQKKPKQTRTHGVPRLLRNF